MPFFIYIVALTIWRIIVITNIMYMNVVNELLKQAIKPKTTSKNKNQVFTFPIKIVLGCLFLKCKIKLVIDIINSKKTLIRSKWNLIDRVISNPPAKNLSDKAISDSCNNS